MDCTSTRNGRSENVAVISRHSFKRCSITIIKRRICDRAVDKDIGKDQQRLVLLFLNTIHAINLHVQYVE